MSIVILAEKPSQAKDYAKAFKKTSTKGGYIEIEDSEFFGSSKVFLTWGIGHLIELVQPEKYQKEWKSWSLETLPISPEKFKFEVTPSKRKQFNIIKDLLKDSKEIYIATDPDREGENIARSIITMAGASHLPTKRLWINSLETDVIRDGFKNLKDGASYLSLYKEAETRQKSDWLVGINASRLYTILLQKQGLNGLGAFSLGRVQTPTLTLINQRQSDNERFVSKSFYELLGEVNYKGSKFSSKNEGRFEVQVEARSELRNHGVIEGDNDGIIQKIDKQLKETPSPKLHSLSSLQSKANKKWKYSPSDVLAIVQDLYEKRIVSYPRTGCQYITNSELDYLNNHLEDYKQVLDTNIDTSETEVGKRYVDGSKVEEHYAIIPTKQVVKLSSLTEKEKNIYKEIIANTLAMFSPLYQYEETKVDVNVDGLVFKKTGKVETDKGWKALFEEEQNNEKEETLPLMSEGESCLVNVSMKEGKTKPPKLYTEGDLINVMKNAGKELEDDASRELLKETKGIGTEATMGSIIETLKRQKYIEVKKNVVNMTEKGKVLCQAVEGTLLASAEMTAEWEGYLTSIGKGEHTQESFISNINTFIEDLIEEAPKKMISMKETFKDIEDDQMVGSCPSCEGGVISDRGKFYGCSSYNDGCRFSLPKRWAGKSLSESQIKMLLEKGKTNLIKGFKSKKGKSFNAYLTIKDNKLNMEFPKR